MDGTLGFCEGEARVEDILMLCQSDGSLSLSVYQCTSQALGISCSDLLILIPSIYLSLLTSQYSFHRASSISYW